MLTLQDMLRCTDRPVFAFSVRPGATHRFWSLPAANGTRVCLIQRRTPKLLQQTLCLPHGRSSLADPFGKIVSLISHSCFVHESRAMIKVVPTGKNLALSYLQGTHRVLVYWLHVVVHMKHITLVYEESCRMFVGIYTKFLIDRARWQHACDIIQAPDPMFLQTIMVSAGLSNACSQ